MIRQIQYKLIGLLFAVIAGNVIGLAQRPFQDNSRSRAGANQLTGTYQLDGSRSDNVRVAVQRATADLPEQQRQRLQDFLNRRLASPEMMAIERRGQTVTMASSSGRQLSLTANNFNNNNPGSPDNNTRVNAMFQGDQLIISTYGNNNRDYSVTFDPIEQGRRLRVTRSITVNQLTRPVEITSIYNKTSDIAQLDLYDEQGNQGPGRDDQRPDRNSEGRFYVPNGTRLVAVLNNNLDTRQTRNNDQFTMRVQSPGEYAGAVIEGYVTNVDRSGRFAGRADMTLNFERIRLRNGDTYNFAADITSVRTLDGEDVRIDEGRIEEGSSQTGQTVKRTGVGAALGAIIGAIAGGGSGAAIGAAVGAGAGAGSLYITGRDDLELGSGTEFVLRASSPRDTRFDR